MLEDILKFNKEFVQNRGYEKYLTNKYPDKKIALITFISNFGLNTCK